MSKKRGHKTLTLADKVKILDELHTGKSGKVLATKYGVGTSTISDIKKNTEKIKKFAENSDMKILQKRKTVKPGEYKEFEEKLNIWFEKQRSRQQIISNEILKEKAKSLFETMYGTENKFKASDGWLKNFKKRFSVRNLKICGEALSSRPDLIPEFQKKLLEIIETEQLLDSQIYNADESALFYKMFPDKTLVHLKEKSAPGRKISKERITFLLCANKTGNHKLRIAVVGKSKNPRSFKKKDVIEYYSSKNAWMTRHIFEQWFSKSFIPQVKKFQVDNNIPLKALLIVDNASCHFVSIESECGQYKIMFLPPNCTSIIQPMDQNAIRLTKLFYKKDLLFELVNSTENDYDDFLKKFSLKNACEILIRSWNKIPSSVIKSCWNKINTQMWSSEDDIPLSILQQQLPEKESECIKENEEIALMKDIFNNSNNEEISTDEIYDWINETVDISFCSSESEEEEENDPTPVQHIKNNEAVQCFNTCINWAKQNNLKVENILLLKEMRNKAIEASLNKTRQTTITTFLKK